ncbi:alkaline phosphatase [Antribacter gilvus]|uniref:alkaline phosphatase n=1 Tax=Antribacter gilvus TaxID=2304675 RepID=UPI0013E097BF|nr:alkaline phosphatase [Antribacter gilvus]
MRHSKTVVAVAVLASLMAAGSVGAYAATQNAASNQGFAEGFTADRSTALAQQIRSSKPRNVILIIGDGMDDSMITAARNYELGAGGRFAGLDSLPFTGSMTTYGLKVGAGPDYPIAYVSDSAPTASGWSTGKKTVDSRISQGPSTAADVPGEDYETVLEKFRDSGKLVGNITTSELTDATPAAAASHINARACQGPLDMAACTSARKSADGKGSIAEQLVDNEVDVLMGGGLNRYSQATDAGPTVLDYAQQEHGYRVLDDKTDLAGVTSLKKGPVLGLFAPGNMTPMYQPLVATAPPGTGGATTKCQDADRGSQPDLSTMTAKAIQLLDNRKGFFLQAESAMIDKQEHGSDICGAIGDLRELDEAVQVALAFQKKNPDTLIIVTGDHAHSTQIVGGVTDGKQVATLQTADGDPMTVAYSTSDVGSDHTGAQIRVAASGPQGANVTGVIDQTDLYRTMLGRSPSRTVDSRD